MPASASILHCGPSEITFTVDKVTPGQERFPTKALAARVEKLTGRSLCVASHALNFPVVEDYTHHALLSAVHLAFSRHLPLALTPDVIWLTIAQGFAHHVNNNAEALRPLLVRHEGKIKLEAMTRKLEEPDDWACAVAQWADQIERRIPSDLQDMLVCDFSTTTPIIRTASQVVLMETFRPYFDFILVCICGIPQITLYGTVEDWLTIRARVERLTKYKLDWWTNRLLPLCDAFIATAKGRPSLSFWQQIYKPKDAYGGETITGWIADLFPYILNATKAPQLKNPLLAKARQKLTAEDGLPADCFPTGLSTAPVTLEMEQPVRKKMSLNFLGGLFGVTQNWQTGCLQPEIGWGVQEQDAFADTLERLARDHNLAAPLCFNKLTSMPEMSGEMIQMLDHFDGGTLFAGTSYPWRLRSCKNYTWHTIGEINECTCFLDLADGRSIGFVQMGWPGKTAEGMWNYRREWWIVVGRPEPASNKQPERSNMILARSESETIFNPEKLVVIAKSLPQFFERMLRAEGRYYFDSPDFVPDAPSVLS